jgi:hypothetical protein
MEIQYGEYNMIDKVKKRYLVVDDENHWLTICKVTSEEEALESAVQCLDYTGEQTLYVFEVVGESRFQPITSEEKLEEWEDVINVKRELEDGTVEKFILLNFI